MNNRERAVLALERRTPDRVPLFELHIDSRVLQKICPGRSYEDFVEDFDFDIVMTGTPSDNYRMEPVSVEQKVYRDEWGVVRRFSDQAVSFPLEGPIKTERDLDDYTPPDPRDPLRFRSLKRLVERFRGERLIGMHVHDAFSYPSYLRGMDNLLMDLIDKPGLVHRLVDMAVTHSLDLMIAARELGAELFVFGDDYAGVGGPFMSPDHFRTFFLPGMREVVQAALKMGAYTIKHTDGNISPLLDMIVDTGIHGLHPLDPEAGMNIAEVKRHYGDRVCVIGNIDTGYLLSDASTSEVEEAVRDAMVRTAPGGGYIISSANSIHAQVKPENYLAMLRASRRFGCYDHLGKEGGAS
jgi:uroporphyrinogen decarboxylase